MLLRPKLNCSDAALQDAWRIIVQECSWLFADAAAIEITVCLDETSSGLEVERLGNRITINAPSRNLVWRGLGLSLGMNDERVLRESQSFSMIGMMLDNSRNAVLSLEGAKRILVYAGLMGINTVMLYTEDTYEVPGEPWFGYLRGAWRQLELAELDDHAHALGIELIPCVQALGHLEQILQWPAYHHLRDTDSVLLADAPETYELIAKMLAAATAPFRSNRIHVGMDEAMGLGTGAYKRKNGETPPVEILMRHLSRVSDACRKLDLSPMIWSDMFFRLGSESGAYYDDAWARPDLRETPIPDDLELVYWDYYHFDESDYKELIDRHRQLGAEPIVATGIWTWNRLWTATESSDAVVAAALDGARSAGAQQVFATLWGDDGAECDLASALPSLLAYADQCYLSDSTRGDADLRFRELFNADATLWRTAAALDVPASLIKKPSRSFANTAKSILWDDPILAMFCAELDAEAVAMEYDCVVDQLIANAEAAGPFSDAVALQAVIGQLLSAKLRLRPALLAAMADDDPRALMRIAQTTIPHLRSLYDDAWRRHRARWLANNRPFGLEVLENRYGGQLIRLQSLILRIREHLAGTVHALDEITQPRLPFPLQGGDGSTLHSRVKTGSTIK